MNIAGHVTLTIAAILVVPCAVIAQSAPRDAFRDWARTQAYPVQLTGSGAAARDLEPLRAIAGNARIIALAEPMHSTREVLAGTYFGTSDGFPNGFRPLAPDTGGIDGFLASIGIPAFLQIFASCRLERRSSTGSLRPTGPAPAVTASGLDSSAQRLHLTPSSTSIASHRSHR